MRHQYRALALAVSLAAFGTVFAQTSAPAKAGNPLSRSAEGPMFYSPLSRPQTLGGTMNNGLSRNQPRNQLQVTPVPEPSQWAMMLAGLALVGFIVRRNAKRK